MWNANPEIVEYTKGAFLGIGDAVGDYLAEQLPNLTPQQFRDFYPDIGAYQGSEKLQPALLAKLKDQQVRWERLQAQRGRNLGDEALAPSGEAREISDWLAYGVDGLFAGFPDRHNLSYLRELAVWGAKNRLKPLCDAVFRTFRERPEEENLSAIDAVWREFSARPYRGTDNALFDVMVTLQHHRYPAAIPLMAQFAGDKLPQALVHEFLKEVSGVDLGSDSKAWLDWYESHKALAHPQFRFAQGDYVNRL